MQSILLVDDHLEARSRIHKILESVFPTATFIETGTIQQAKREIEKQPFDIAILDLSLPDGKGETLISPLKRQREDCQIVIWTIDDRSARLIEVLANGANGYLLKDQEESQLKTAFERLIFGDPPMAAPVKRRVLEFIQKTGGNALGFAASTGAREGAPASTLTEREMEILGLLAKGFNRPDIAGILNISRSTAATHTANIYTKLGASSRVEAIEIAHRLKLI